MTMCFESSALPPLLGKSPKRWRATKFFSVDPLEQLRAWGEEAGHSYPVTLSRQRLIVSLSPEVWRAIQTLRIARYSRERLCEPHMNKGAPPSEAVYRALPPERQAQCLSALSRCVAVHVSGELERGAPERHVAHVWRGLCQWAVYVALLSLDLKREPAEGELQASLRRLEQAWGSLHPSRDERVLSARRWREVTQQLSMRPALGALGDGLGPRLTIAAQLSLDLSSLGQWFWLQLAQAPELRATLTAEVRHGLGDEPYQAQHLKRLPTLTSTLLELMRLYPPVWWCAKPITPELLAHLEAHPQLSELSPLISKHRAQQLCLSPYWLQRDGDLWDDPERFDPRRFFSLALSGAVSASSPSPSPLSDLAASSSGAETPWVETFERLAPFGLEHPTKSARAQLTLHALSAMLTSLLRRGSYVIEAPPQAVPLELYAQSLCPSEQLKGRLIPDESLSFVPSTRV